MSSEPTRDLVARPTQQEIIRPLDPQSVVQAMEQHQALVRAILDESDWQGQPDRPGSFVKKSGWRKVAAGYSLSIARVHEEVERSADGKPLRASYTAAAIAPNGRRVESTGHCSYDESRFSGPRGNESKLENDMRATAETRAKNRAISDLIGMGKVSAEEADAGHPEAGPTHGPAVDPATDAKLPDAVALLLDADRDRAVALLLAIWERLGYMPRAVAEALLLAAVDKRDGGQPPAPAPEASPAQGAAPAGADTPPAEEPPAGEPEPVDATVVDETPPAPEPAAEQPKETLAEMGERLEREQAEKRAAAVAAGADGGSPQPLPDEPGPPPASPAPKSPNPDDDIPF